MMAPRVTLTSTKPWRKTSLDLASNPLHGAERVEIALSPIKTGYGNWILSQCFINFVPLAQQEAY
jgi:hypothetical protein